MTQYRINSAIHGVGVKDVGDTGSYTPVYGAQSVSSNITFNQQRYFMLGISETYQTIEDVPDISLTVNKLLDGRPMVYHLATQSATSFTLLGRQNAKCILAWSVVDDTYDSLSGTPLATAEASGLFPSSLNYTFPVDSPASEEITLVGNHIEWSAGGATKFGSAFTGTIFDNTEEPLNIAESGGIQTRDRFIFNGQSNVTLLPIRIPGISSSGTNDVNSEGFPTAKVQSVNISTDLGRENILQLGVKAPYYKSISLPVDVNCTVEVISLSGSFQSATEAGVEGNGQNTRDEAIKVVLQDGSVFDLGTRNRLQGVDFGGADTGGGNATETYNYQNGNFLTITHPQAP